MNKTLLTISAVALSSSTAVAYNTDMDVNQSYIKLASISPLVESDLNMVVSQNFDLSVPLDPDDPTDPDHPVNKSCVARGFDVVGGCDATGDCIPDLCPENPLYMACTCFCAVNSCTENGYLEQTCGKYDIETDCPMLPNQGFVKCEEMEGFEKCIVDEYYDSAANCTGYKIEEECPYDAGYEKCVNMDDEEKCITDGYDISACPSGQELSDKCPHGNENLYKNCVATDCASEFVSSCSAGYKLDTSSSCVDGDGTKYLCIAEDCTGYDQTSPCSPLSGYTQTTCLSGTTTKYMCVPNVCSGYNETSPCGSGYIEETCQAGSTLKYKCTINECIGYSPEPCPKPIDTCQKGSQTYYLGCGDDVGDEPLQCQPDGNTWCMTNGFNRQSVWMCDFGEVEENCPCENNKGFKRCVTGETGICNNIICTTPRTGPVDSNGDGCLDICTPCNPSDNTRICVADDETPDYTCSFGYTEASEYNVNTDCYVVPYKLVYEPGKPSCVKCECDNSSTPGLDCMYK